MSNIQKREEIITSRNTESMLNEKEPIHSTEECSSSECPPNLKSKIYNYIGSFAEAPSFVKDNRFILHGYRLNYDSPKKIFKSLFVLHNELVNIWTHLLGAVLVICLIISVAFFLKPSIPNIKNEIQNDIHRIVSPIYEELKKIENSLNEHTLETLNQIKLDISEYNKNIGQKYQDVNQNIKERIDYIIQHLEEIKDTINKDNVNYLYDSIQQYLRNYTSTMIDDISTIISKPFHENDFGLSTLKNYTGFLADGLDGIKTTVLEKIDSESYDWIDLYVSIQSINKEKASNHVSRWPIFIFLISAILCLLFSAFFHLFYEMNKKTCNKMMCLDYAGISLLISGSTFPPFVYSFYCEPKYYIFYESIIGVACMVVFVMSLFDSLHKAEYRKLKGILYGSLGIFAGFPIFHLVLKEIFKDPNALDKFTAMPIVPNFLLMGVCYLVGLTIYVYQCPERFRPGKFDIWGSSHQLWHLMIVIAIIITYFGSLEAYHQRIENKCPIS